MTLQETQKIIQDYFFDHANQMTQKQSTAFLMTLLALPLVPECYHLYIGTLSKSVAAEIKGGKCRNYVNKPCTSAEHSKSQAKESKI